MRGAKGIDRRLCAAGVAAAALIVTAGPAFAGGFDIHEQSTVFLGSAMAGAAAGGSLGTMYWNPAGAGQFSGLNTESSYILVLPNGDLHVTSFGGGPVSPSSNSGNIGIDAVTSSTYGTYRLSNDFWVGIAINSPFGLATKPGNTQYLGSYLGVTSKLLTINANPMFAYRIAPGITIGAGVQMEWARGKLQFRTSPTDIAQFKGDDWAFGATAGILLEPAAGTSIGLGWRSALSHDLDGSLHSSALSGGRQDAVGTIDLPDIVTLSLRQEITPRTRLLGTVQWENWSEFKQLTVDVNTFGPITTPTNWDDSWYFSIGGEYDYTPALTLRTGVGYEMSPVNDPTQRLVQVPDNDRVYLSIGASYKWSDFTTIDVGYSHIFIRDGDFDQGTPVGAVPISGYVDDASVDMFSVGFRKVW